MGFVEQFVALLQRERDSTHEHLLAALFALTNDHAAAIVECRRSEFHLRELLENRIESSAGQEEFEVLTFCYFYKYVQHSNRYETVIMLLKHQEEVEYCRQLLAIIFKGDSFEDDR